LTKVRFIGNRKFRICFGDFGSNLRWCKTHCSQIIGGEFWFLRLALYNFIVAAIASSMYIIGILVSDDRNTRIFYRLVLCNIHCIPVFHHQEAMQLIKPGYLMLRTSTPKIL
jgi:hypothetical protein